MTEPFNYQFNLAFGCTEVSPGCDHCFARTVAEQSGQGYLWDKNGLRRTYSDDYWRQPFYWNQFAIKQSQPVRVLASPKCDPFEDHPVVNAARTRLWSVIRMTPYLDWWLLTKRSEQIEKNSIPDLPNLHIGVSIESQEFMYRVVRRVDWICAEPMLGALDIRTVARQLRWVMAGGENGGGARATELVHLHGLCEQCDEFDVPFYLKQVGRILAKQLGLSNQDGYDAREWPAWMNVRQFPRRLKN